jgi:hypothetical protein
VIRRGTSDAPPNSPEFNFKTHPTLISSRCSTQTSGRSIIPFLII